MFDDDSSDTTRRTLLQLVGLAGIPLLAGTASAGSGDHLGETWSGDTSSGHGLKLDVSNGDHGLIGETDSGIGVYGWATSSSDATSIGVYGESSSTQGEGVIGVTTANSGETKGVKGKAQSSSGYGVYGTNSTDGDGVYGESNNGGNGVYGVDQGSGAGVRGKATGSLGYGVSGFAPNGHGVFGATEADGRAGIIARNNADNATDGYGLYAYAASSDAYAIYSAGDLHVEGDFTASGTKNFVQTVETADGPKEVAYTAVESDTPQTETTGVAELEDGRAEIDLPDHFGLVTSDEEDLVVQLTPYAVDAPRLAVTERSTDRIVVEAVGGASDAEFSYTVRGTREGYEDEQVVSESEDA